MDTVKLDRWADLLLDIGKKNNLINYRDTKTSTLEVLAPEPSVLFTKAEDSTTFEVYDPKISAEEESDEESDDETEQLSYSSKNLKRDDFLAIYRNKIGNRNRILLFNEFAAPIPVLKNIERKGRSAIEETGVNIMHLAFGFICWKEKDYSEIVFRAPILLVPVEFINESAISPHFIKANADETVVNPTFCYKLKSEFGVELPAYEGDDFDVYMKKIESVVSKLGFSVDNSCRLGSFSFLKINMYNDLQNNRKKILENRNVLNLFNEADGNNTPDGDYSFGIPEDSYHLENPILQLNSVVDADSSQIEAIELAKAGYSFVLQGPPGTGKSQTITNIIAECLADGKKILFVSEKQAALNVVYDKLKKAGLSEFCLELHSHKANKKEFIAEICHTLLLEKTELSERAEEELDQKAKSQKMLDAYETLLHQNRDVINKSLYQLFESYSACRTAPDLNTPIPDIDSKDEIYLAKQVDLLEQYVRYIPSIGYDYRENPWYGYFNTSNSFDIKRTVKENLSACNYTLKDVLAFCTDINSSFKLNISTFKDACLFSKLFAFISSNDVVFPRLFDPDILGSLIQKLEALKSSSTEIRKLEAGIEEEYEKDIYKLPHADIYKRLTKIFKDGMSRTFSGDYRQILTDIRMCRIDGKKPSYQEAVDIMQKLDELEGLTFQYLDIEDSHGMFPLLGDLYAYKGYSTDFDSLMEPLKTLQGFFNDGLDVSGLSNLSKEEYADCRPKLKEYGDKLTSAISACSDPLIATDKAFDKNIYSFYRSDIQKSITKLEACLGNIEGIDNWYRFSYLLNELNKANLIEYLGEALNSRLENNQIPISYKKTFYRQWIEYVLDSEATLQSISRIPHDNCVAVFTEKDRLHFDINKVKIKKAISANRPNNSMVAAGSASSILLREGEKKRKQKPIRTVLDEAGELIQVLKPCFLMSPLSVSTFLTSGKIHFDVVVFDEASQIFPQDAIGAIYRADQLIVVGDSRQMPPSNFFNAMTESDEEDEEIGDVTDFESILDICSASMLRKRLQWHYRSRYEQLIAFSNYNFYDNSLVTFPSAETDRPGIGVDFYFADGVYSRKSHNNRIEAEYIVDLIYKNFEQYPDRSLGVVAFSVSQQTLIEKLLYKRRIERSDMEKFFRNDLQEPFFVKNLETVQGDERDTIIFSVAYARDKDGRFIHNFGPINREGGERRLNVAVTRAKSNVQVVSSIHYTDIELTEKSGEGIRLLREYLDFAENGRVIMERNDNINLFDEFDSEFEMEVCDFLRKNGYTVDTQIGCSGFRIDIGLRKPGSDDYLLAIECDGATYHSSKNARDRDRLRQQVLENMGWKFYRIWSTDWYLNNAAEKQQLIDAINVAMSDRKAFKQAEEENRSVQSSNEFEETLPNYILKFPEYEYAGVEALINKYYKDRDFKSLILEILKVEAPISEEWLLKRILPVFGREKITSVVLDEFNFRMRNCESWGIARKNSFLYLSDNKKYVLRVPKDDGELRRELKYICPEELAAGMLILLKENVSAEKDGLYRTIVNILGYKSLSQNATEILDDGFKLIKKYITIYGDIILYN